MHDAVDAALQSGVENVWLNHVPQNDVDVRIRVGLKVKHPDLRPGRLKV